MKEGKDTEVIEIKGTENKSANASAAETTELFEPVVESETKPADDKSKGEQKPEEDQQQGKPEGKDEDKFVSKEAFQKRINELIAQRDAERKKYGDLEKRLQTQEDTQYKAQREATKSRLLAEGMGEEDVNFRLKVMDLENENKFFKAQILLSSKKDMPSKVDDIINEYKGTLPVEQQARFDIVKDDMRKKLDEVEDESARSDKNILEIAYHYAIGKNIDKLTKKSDGAQIADFTGGGSKGAPGVKTVQVKLSKDEMDYCKSVGIDPAKFAENKHKYGQRFEITPEQSQKI